MKNIEWNWKRKRKRQWKNRQEKKKRGPNGVLPETAQKNDFWQKSFDRKSWGNQCKKKKGFWAPEKKEQEEKKMEKKKDKNSERKCQKM